MIDKNIVSSIEDQKLRFVLEEIIDIVNISPFSSMQGRFIEEDMTEAVTAKNFSHNLGFAPKQLILTYWDGTGDFSWVYEDITKTALSFTTTSAGKMRAFIGNYTGRTL